jgi:hypothetical protein
MWKPGIKDNWQDGKNRRVIHNYLTVEPPDLAGSRAEIRIDIRDEKDARPFGHQGPK